MEVVQQYFDAWNRHDAVAIMAVFSDGGTYADLVSGALSGPVVGAYAETPVGRIPDLSLEIASAGLAGENLVAAEWIMRAANLAR